jgi:two-component system chemotaxis sensor kinase CheA
MTMKYEKLAQLMESLASDFVFLDQKEIDVPTAGNFLNILDQVSQEAEADQVGEAAKTAGALSVLLEKIVLLQIGDAEKAYQALEKGITAIQQVVSSYQKMGKSDRDVNEILSVILDACGDDRIRELMGERKKEEGAAPQPLPEETKEGPPEIEDEGLLRDFITEGLEYISEIEVNILNLEQNPTDKDCINAIFRPFHSVKGVAGFLNLSDIRGLAHTLENLLDKARNDELEVTQALIDAVLDGSDTLKSMIGQLKDRLEGKEMKPLNTDLSLLMKRVEAVGAGEEQEKPQKLGQILISGGALSEESLEKSLQTSQESTPKKKIGETLIQEGKVSPKQVTHALRKQAEQVSDTTTIRIDTRKLDDLIDMVGELVITQSMIQQGLSQQFNGDRKLMRTVAQFFRITSELQRTSTSLRMMPIKQTFQRMARLARDLGKNNGKQVAVELVGEETEIDRNMVDEIYNPLVHMVRNSVDHGLEAAEERQKAGKPEKGLIQLKAYHRGGNIVIEIVDDGKGLNREKILDKGKKNGLIHSTENLADQDIFRLIFLPGFSTAEKVTEVSGRGVGMDVVRQAIDRLRGKIEIESTPGKGTTFALSFPLTLAIIDGMIVKVGSERYIVPTTAIRQALRPAREAYNAIAGRGETINVMGSLLPLVRVYELFGKEPRHRNPWEAIIVVTEGEGRAKCLMVDEIVGKAEVVIKSLGEGLKNIQGISGGAILGDGQIGLIIDPEGLFELSEGNRNG